MTAGARGELEAIPFLRTPEGLRMLELGMGKAEKSRVVERV